MGDITSQQVQRAVDHARTIADTWNSDMNQVADCIEETGADVNEVAKQLNQQFFIIRVQKKIIQAEKDGDWVFETALQLADVPFGF